MKTKKYFAHTSAFIDKNVSIGENSKIWHNTHIQSHSFIGDDCSIGQNVYVAKNVRIGNNVKIQNNVSVYEGVELEDYVFCGPSMVFTNVKNPRSEFPQNSSKNYKKTLVKKSASIGANATILCGLKIGKYAFIGAGAVVLDNVPDFGLVVGNPGRLVGWVNEFGERLIFESNGTSTCGRFSFDGNSLKLLDIS